MVMNIEISAAVGRRGANRPHDVTTIQSALNALPVEKGGPMPRLIVDGIVDERTLTAIIEFQRHHEPARRPNGRVDPGGHTLAQLNVLLSTHRALSTSETSTGEIVIALPVNGHVPLAAGSKLEIATLKIVRPT